MKVPKEVLPRFVEISKGTFVPLEDIIAAHLDTLFPGMEVVSHSLFRVSRDADFDISDEADDLLAAVEDELRRRRFGEVVRLEVAATSSRACAHAWSNGWSSTKPGLQRAGHARPQRPLADRRDRRPSGAAAALMDAAHPPGLRSRPEDTGDQPDIFAQMREGEFLVHYPYQSFSASVERLVMQASEDPNVLAIKMTVYRTSDDSELVPALITAAENGKQAVCMVELKARFDERQNIRWSRELEEVGAHVVHGIPGLKTHAKAILVVRREHDGVRHYVMIGTGNFHAKNARLYEDFGFFTTDREIGQEVANLFNALTATPTRGAVARCWWRPTRCVSRCSS